MLNLSSSEVSLYLKFQRFGFLSLLINIFSQIFRQHNELTLSWAFEKLPGKSMKPNKKSCICHGLAFSEANMLTSWSLASWLDFGRVSRGRAFAYGSLWCDFTACPGRAKGLWVLQHVDIVYFQLPTSSTMPVISTFLCMWARHISQWSLPVPKFSLL